MQTKPPLLRPAYHTRTDARRGLYGACVTSRRLLINPCQRPCFVLTFSVHLKSTHHYPWHRWSPDP